MTALARLNALPGRFIPRDAALLLLRVAIATPFWLSGRTKVDGLLTLNDGARFLFAEEYKVPILPPEVAAHLATWAEHLFPILLVLGLATRLSALGLIGMTLVIQLFVYPLAFPTHALWAASALVLLVHGGGRLALDRPLARRFARKGA